MDRSFGKWPWCKVCNKPVDTVTADDNFWNQTRRFTVGCHGQTETSVLTHEMLDADIEFGWAFDTKQIGE